MSVAYARGHKAGNEGKGMDACPYKDHRRSAWVDGFDVGTYERLEREFPTAIKAEPARKRQRPSTKVPARRGRSIYVEKRLREINQGVKA